MEPAAGRQRQRLDANRFPRSTTPSRPGKRGSAAPQPPPPPARRGAGRAALLKRRAGFHPALPWRSARARRAERSGARGGARLRARTVRSAARLSAAAGAQGRLSVREGGGGGPGHLLAMALADAVDYPTGRVAAAAAAPRRPRRAATLPRHRGAECQGARCM